MKQLFAVALILCIATPAFAALAPEYYQRARDEAADVVVIDVTDVSAPPARGYGDCNVTGTVAAVERGETYAVGQDITIAVSCRLPNAPMMVGGILWKGFEELRAAPAGRAYLNNGAVALSQYEILAEKPHHDH